MVLITSDYVAPSRAGLLPPAAAALEGDVPDHRPVGLRHQRRGASPGTQSQVTPAHAQHQGRYLEFESRVTQAVIIITEPLIRSCVKMGTPVEPFLVALATTANIGSAISLTGNPQVISWTAARHDGPNHLGLCCDALPERRMALITSDACWQTRRTCLSGTSRASRSSGS